MKNKVCAHSEEKIKINTVNIRLDQFLKWAGLVQTGGEAKNLIIQGYVLVNDVPEEKRGRLLKNGDKIVYKDLEKVFIVIAGGE